MSETDYANQIWTKAHRNRNVFSDGQLKWHFIARWPHPICIHVQNHHSTHPDLTLRQLVTCVKGYGKNYRTSLRTGDAGTWGCAKTLTRGSKAHIVESLWKTDSASGHSETADVLAVSSSSDLSGAPSASSSGPTTPLAPVTTFYFPTHPRRTSPGSQIRAVIFI